MPSSFLSADLPDEKRRAKAFEIFCDIDLESSKTSRWGALIPRHYRFDAVTVEALVKETPRPILTMSRKWPRAVTRRNTNPAFR